MCRSLIKDLFGNLLRGSDCISFVSHRMTVRRRDRHSKCARSTYAFDIVPESYCILVEPRQRLVGRLDRLIIAVRFMIGKAGGIDGKERRIVVEKRRIVGKKRCIVGEERSIPGEEQLLNAGLRDTMYAVCYMR